MQQNTLAGKSLLTLKDLSSEEIRYLIDLSQKVKQERKEGKTEQRFIGKTLALIFEKRSTRTRCAFETAFGEAGGYPVFLSTADIQLGAKETIEDTARVLGRMFDAIQFRGFKQKTVEFLAQYSGIPVYNGLTDQYHPTQVLADLMTIEEQCGQLKGKKLCFVGDGRNNVATSLMIGCAKMGVNMTIVAPASLFPDNEHYHQAKEIAISNDAKIIITQDIREGAKNADAIYTDVWTSMGEEHKQQERKTLLQPYQVNQEVMDATGKTNTIFLHCLPAVKGEEVTYEIIESSASKVWDEAENRKHTIKALMIATIK